MRLKFFGEFIKEIERNPDYLINEIADKKRKRTPIVKTEGTAHLTTYKFYTDKSEYLVKFVSGEFEHQEVCELSFEEISGISVTNHNEIIDVISGVIDTIVDYIQEKHPALLYFYGEYKEKEDRSFPSIRTKLYYEYVKKHINNYFSNVEVKLDENRILIYFKYE